MAGKIDFSQVNADLQKMEDDQKNRKFKKFKKISLWTLKKGEHKVLVLPPLTDDSPLYLKIQVCYGYVDSKNQKRAYRSSMDKHGRCPLVDNYKRVKESGDTEAAQAIQPKTFYLYNVMDANKATKVLMANTTQHKEILAEMQNAGQDGVELDTAEGARFIKVNRLAVTPWARARMEGKSAGITQEEFDKALAEAVELDEAFVDYSPEDLERMLQGEDISKIYTKTEEEGEGEGEEQEPEVKAPVKETPKVETKKEVVKETPKVETKAPVKETPKVEGIKVETKSEDEDMADIMALLE